MVTEPRMPRMNKTAAAATSAVAPTSQTASVPPAPMRARMRELRRDSGLREEVGAEVVVLLMVEVFLSGRTDLVVVRAGSRSVWNVDHAVEHSSFYTRVATTQRRRPRRGPVEGARGAPESEGGAWARSGVVAGQGSSMRG